MKLFELFGTTAPIVTEELLIEKINEFDWAYEFSESEWRQRQGQKNLEELERMVFNFWKEKPNEAIKLWNNNAPCGIRDSSVVPEFIVRMSLQ